MRLLVFTTLFPRPHAPHHGVFVLERLRHWRQRHGGDAVVIAPVPALPNFLARGRWAQYGDIPPEEQIDGFRVLHPRFVVIPKVGMSVAPLLLARAGLRVARALHAAGERFDLLDAHYLYPDAVAAAFLARELRLPLVVTARGTDVNLIPRHALPRRWLEWMLRRASFGIAVAEALRTEMAKLAPQTLPGLPLATLRNGVDLEKFRPLPRDEARAQLGWKRDRRVVLSVGHLVERKGHHHAIAALPLLPPDVDLKIVGAGEWRAKLAAQAAALPDGIGSRVELCGAMAHAQLHVAYSAAEALTLLSAREGWPNVLLESMACGTPVVATRVFGTPEVVRERAAGLLVDSTAPTAVAAALNDLLASAPARAATRAFAERHSWNETADALQQIFERVAPSAKSARPAPSAEVRA